MKKSEYCNYDGLGLAQLVRAGEVSSLELAHCATAMIEELNPSLNAVLEAFPDVDQILAGAGSWPTSTPSCERPLGSAKPRAAPLLCERVVHRACGLSHR